MTMNRFMSNPATRVVLLLLFMAAILLYADSSFAEGIDKSVGDIAETVTGSIAALVKLIIAGAYIAGIGFALGAIMKFKQHKDNPTQIPIGTPIALVFIATALIFLPTIISLTQATLFGKGASGVEAGGTKGGGAKVIPGFEDDAAAK